MEVVADVAEKVFGGVWNLLLKTDFPGLGVSIAGVAIAVLLIRFSVRIFSFFTGFRGGAGDVGRAADAAEKAKAAYDRKNGS